MCKEDITLQELHGLIVSTRGQDPRRRIDTLLDRIRELRQEGRLLDDNARRLYLIFAQRSIGKSALMEIGEELRKLRPMPAD